MVIGTKRGWARLAVSLLGIAVVVGATALPAYAVLTVTGYQPNPVSGASGCQVVINGTDFTGVTGVTFNGPPVVAAPAGTFTADSPTQITVTVPATADDGTVTVFTTAAPAGATGPNLQISGTGNCPTITSFTPTSGGPGTTVTLTGTNFTGATAVKFGAATTAPSGTPTATSLTVVVPAGATAGPIRVLNANGWGSSTTSFSPAPAPTITSFTPLYAPVGKTVTITGTNFTGATSVKFNNVAATAFTVNSATQITATVPTGATTGKITVTTPGGTATSTANFTVSTLHSRSVTLSLKKHLVAKGSVSAADSFSGCVSSVPVKIQRKSSGGWKNVKSTTTSSSGAYKVKMKDKPGKYRAKATKVVLSSGTDVCSGATSAVRTNK
jgi:hypothetical protein